MNDFGSWVILTLKSSKSKIAINLDNVVALLPLEVGSKITWVSPLSAQSVDVMEDIHDIFRRGVS
jgi:hypothetical protein